VKGLLQNADIPRLKITNNKMHLQVIKDYICEIYTIKQEDKSEIDVTDMKQASVTDTC
jgi:hypothetical protein